jgi:hypothetical protein
MITGVDLFGFTVRNAAKTIAYYKDVLEMTPTDERPKPSRLCDLCDQRPR